MKITTLLLVFLMSAFAAVAQLGKSKQELIALYGQENVLKETKGKPGYSGMLIKLDTVSFVQATFRGDQAVMLSYVHADSMLTEARYLQYLGENMPQFKAGQQCALGDKTYLMNAQRSQLVVQNHAREEGKFPLIGLILATDPAIISGLSDKIRQFCK